MMAHAPPTERLTLRQALKRGTARAHRRLEIQLGVLDANLDLRRYRRILERFYGFYAPVEDGLRPLSHMIPFPLRARTVLIEHDLAFLGLSSDEISSVPRCSALPALSCTEDLVGCMYVLEGASLGGQVITPVLRRRLGVAKDSGASFFAGDEDGTAARWATVVAWLDELQDVAPQPVVAAANATFEALARWMGEQERPWSM